MVLYVEGVWGVGDVDVIVDEFMSKVCSSRQWYILYLWVDVVFENCESEFLKLKLM